MSPATARPDAIDPYTREVYCRALKTLDRAAVPFLVGGAYAFERYTAIARHTKDLDVFVHRRDLGRVFELLSAAGYRTELTFPHWLGKALMGEALIDVIFGSGNGVAEVDDEWFAHGVDSEVLGVRVTLCPPEEMIWSKAFIMERERYDGADIAHLLHARGTSLDWRRLLTRFGPHWRVLLSHLTLFGFIYPAERSRIPAEVMREFLRRLEGELGRSSPEERLCQGTLLSREQYLVDVMQWGFRDARLFPRGAMTMGEVAQWTAAIEVHGDSDGNRPTCGDR
ncbi:MAG: hypothetical protein ACRELA_22725 [Candidatus Rokuibacteriota bacterium]